MRFGKVILAILLSIPLRAATAEFGGTRKSAIVNSAYDFIGKHRITDSDSLIDFSNLGYFPNLSIGSSLKFGTILTLERFDCFENKDRQAKNGFQCQIDLLYCFERNEFPPSRHFITLTGLPDGSVQDVKNLLQDVPENTCAGRAQRGSAVLHSNRFRMVTTTDIALPWNCQ